MGCCAGGSSASGTVVSGVYPPAHPRARTTRDKLFPLARRALEPVVVIPEQHVERGKRAVASRDVLLQPELLVLRELGVAVDPLLQQSQAVADHHDLVEEGLDGHLLVLHTRAAGAEYQLAAAVFVCQ